MKISRLILAGSQILSLASAALYTAAYLPGAPIQEFHVTLLIPPTTQSATTPNGSQLVYIALQPDAPSILQLPIIYSNFTWQFTPTWCCDATNNGWAAPSQLYAPQRVYPGDEIFMEFFLQGNVWVLQWGTVSASKGTTLQQGSVDFDASNPYSGNFTKAIFSIEVNDGAAWDFGTVTWTNVSILAQTTQSNWCSSPILSSNPEPGIGRSATGLNNNGMFNCDIKLNLTTPGS